MTHDKELIERLALEQCVGLEAAGELYVFSTSDLKEFLAAYLAERGTKSGSITSACREQFESWLSDLDPRPFLPDAYNDQVYKWKGWKAAWNRLASQQPAIPEGMALVGYVAPETIINLRNGTRYGGARISPRVDEDDGLTEPIFAAAGVKPCQKQSKLQEEINAVAASIHAKVKP